MCAVFRSLDCVRVFVCVSIFFSIILVTGAERSQSSLFEVIQAWYDCWVVYSNLASSELPTQQLCIVLECSSIESSV
jgi:hypothetical protein